MNKKYLSLNIVHIAVPMQINFELLDEQKQILIRMITDWGEATDPDQQQDANTAEGILSIIDAIQDTAIDVYKIPEKIVLPKSKSK